MLLAAGIALRLLLFLGHANALPITSQLTEEDEKVTKCITEILADTLSKPSPVPVTSECMKILREDERVLAMLHHQHLLSELEELAHQENAKHRLGHEDPHDAWGAEGAEKEEVKKREERPSQQRAAAASEKMRQQEGEWKEEGQGLKEYQKTVEEKVKEVSHREDHREALEDSAAKEEIEDEGDGDVSRKKKRRVSSETWSSREYFGQLKNRGSVGPKIREVMLQGSQDTVQRRGSDKRSFEPEGEEEEDDSSEEKPMSHRHGGYHHHEDWEDEEEEGERKKRRGDLAKRVAEKASNEETAQFEEEEKGVKISNSKGHLHGGWKPWPEQEGQEEEEEEGEMRYGHHHRSTDLDLKKRHGEDHPKGRHHGHEEDEGEREASQDEARELEKLQEIEQDLQKAAEKLRELKRGSHHPPRHGQV
ncbi:coiled-coil domain-containing glutamate-rich protein 2 [Paroedura picta]|uniref:coiled-coil domain-containing glutamate-rich protein 2 n=1 Tax=Paroedura picta TaxID=143630 RepID=UPI0040569DDC